jgi:hypothetical protein
VVGAELGDVAFIEFVHRLSSDRRFASLLG